MPKKKHKHAFRKATDRLESEGRRQCALLYGSCAIALNRHWKKGKDAIVRLFDVSGEIWHECASTNLRSMVEMCETETGIEVQCGNGKTWRDLPYMNGSLQTARMTEGQWIYMRQQQIKWIAPQVMACIMIALHRKYGFGFDRLSRIYGQIREIEAEFQDDDVKIRDYCRKELMIDIYDVFTRQREVKEVV